MAKKRSWRLPTSLTSSRKRLALLTITLMCLLVASIGALIAHNITEALSLEASLPYQKVDILQNDQRLIVGTSPDQKPLRFNQEGEITGFEAELMTAVGHQLGLAVEFKTLAPDQVFGEAASRPSNPLNNNLIHLYISSAPTNRMNQQYFSLSQPYLNQAQVAIGRSEQSRVENLEQLSSKVVAVVKFQAGQALASQYVKSNSLLEVSSDDQLVQRILNNQADVGLIDLATAKHLVRQHPEIGIVSPTLSQNGISILSSRSNYEIINLVDQALATLEKQGALLSLQKKWLESYE